MSDDELNVPTVPTAEGDAQFKPGDRLGRYVLLSTAGQGGMSVVYLAYDPDLDRKVALKLMRIGLLGPQGRARLQREAQALARLSHPNVVPVYDVGTVDDQAFVAMEYVEGETLKRWLLEPKSWREVLRVMMDAGRGLAAAHAAGLVHRDVKPDNVLLGRDGRVRVLDFGLARPAEDLSGDPTPPADAVVLSDSGRLHESVTRADQVLGTPAYMAPEQVAQGATDARADQFSFCVTLYEALYKQKPYDTVDTVSAEAVPTIAEKLNHGPRTLAAHPPRSVGVPGWVEKIVMRGLRVDPVDRFPSMDALLAALSRDPAERRRRWVIAIGTAALLVAGGVTVVRGQRAQRALCRGGEERVQAVWNAPAQKRIHAAFVATGVPYAEAAAQSVQRALDGYGQRWAGMHQQACEATRLRGEQSDEVLDLRMACLADRLKEVSALSEALQEADAEAVREAAHAAASLTPVEECADIAALRAPVAQPRDPAVRARIEAARERLAKVLARYHLGKTKEAAEAGEALLKDVKALGFSPLTAEVGLWLGRSYADLGEEKRSIPTFKDAFAVALAARNDLVLRQASVRLAQEYIYKHDLGESRYWMQVAESALVRTGGHARTENFLQHIRCVGLWQEGVVVARFECLKKHAARQERTQPLTDWELTTLGLAASDAGRLEASTDYLQRGVDYSTRENGAAHPRTLEMRGYLCKGYLDLGEYARAETECGDTLRLAEKVAPDNHYVLGKIHLYLGATLRELKQYDEARRHLQIAVKDVSPAGEALTELAQVASAVGDHATALATFRKSLAEDEKELGAAHPNIVLDRLSLGSALLTHGDAEEARAVLEKAHAAAEKSDLSPYMIADVAFAYARALWLTRPNERPRALTLARSALERYAIPTPHAPRLLGELARIDRWLAAPR